MLQREKETEAEFVSTHQAADMLGLSTTSVKKLVESHQLLAWKTDGGHRRISVESILAYRNQVSMACWPGKGVKNPFIVTLVHGQKAWADELAAQMNHWGLTFDIRSKELLHAAIIEMSVRHRNILLIDTEMPLIEIAQLAKALDDLRALNHDLHTVIFTTKAKELHEQSQHLPANLKVVTGKITPDWLQAFLMGYSLALVK